MTSSISASERARRSRIRAGLTSGARRGIAAMALAAILVPLVYVLLILFQLGSWHGANWWLRDIIALRRILYADVTRDLPPDTRKNVVVAGSASLFGVNGWLITSLTGEETLNFGLHAGLELDMLLAQADRNIDANDRVVIPLEFELYPRDAPTDLTPADFLAFFYKDAGAIPPAHLPAILMAISPVRVIEGVVDRILALAGKPMVEILSDAVLKERWQQAHADPAALQSGSAYYSYLNLDAHGDKVLVRNTPADAEADVVKLPSARARSVSPYTAKILDDWAATLALRKATLFMTWPVILQDSLGTVLQPNYWQFLIDLARDAEAKGHPIHCDPIEAIVPVQYRFDTAYHVNFKGQALYSAALGACLRNGGAPFDWAHADAADLARKAQARIDALKVPSDPLVFGYERNLRLLAALKDAIEAAHRETGRYPEDSPPLPPSPAVKEIGAAPLKPWYRSDGASYKLLAEDPEDCFTVRAGWPERVDPARATADRCTAYGYWSEGAASW